MRKYDKSRLCIRKGFHRNNTSRQVKTALPLLSIVVPTYNEEESIDYVVPALCKALNSENINFEVIFIDDGSSDSTYEKISAQSTSTVNVRGYRFSRNFGKEAAIWAGLQMAHGDCCVVMDCDLQHPPEALPRFYRLWEDGYEIVEGIKKSRGSESLLYKAFSKSFYRTIATLSGLDMRDSSDFKLLDKRVVNILLQLNERNTFFRGLSYWVGFRSVKMEYEVAPRHSGNTKWNFFKLCKYALNNIAGFSSAPLQLVTFVGTILIAASAILGIQTLAQYFSGYALEGFTTIILLILLIGGHLMISLGVIGLYIAKIYDEVKNRPRFIISESTADEEKL